VGLHKINHKRSYAGHGFDEMYWTKLETSDGTESELIICVKHCKLFYNLKFAENERESLVRIATSSQRAVTLNDCYLL